MKTLLFALPILLIPISAHADDLPVLPEQSAPASPAQTPAPAQPSASVAAMLGATPSPEQPKPFTGDPNKMWNVTGAVRIGFVADPAFDNFSSNDVLPQWTFSASRTVLSRGRLSLAAGASWDIGGTSGNVRGAESGFLTTRFTAPIEARYHARTWLYGFARIAPGAQYYSARIEDPSASSTLIRNDWMFATDVSVGASITSFTQPGGPRVWLTPEIGYAWSTASRLRLAPKDQDPTIGGVDKTDLGNLALRGPFFRIGAGLTF